ncbi:hypothetical protein JTB14_037226 [Gonioctena quinquepunctata]|nr:hypothetical protein JTB14_037226 [Gonioctena quinquepunctata]
MITQKEYKQCTADLKKTILDAKQGSWKILLEEVDLDTWREGHQIVTNKLKGKPLMTPANEEQMYIAKTLFSFHGVKRWTGYQQVNDDKAGAPELRSSAGSELENITVKIEGKNICSEESIEYFCIHMDRNMRTGTHVGKTA